MRNVGFFSNTQAGKYDIYMLALGTPTMDPGYAMIFFGKGAPSGYNDAQVQQLLAEGDATVNSVAQSNAYYSQAQALVWEHGPWAALYFQPIVDGTSKSLFGYAPRVDEYEIFDAAYIKA